MTSDVVGIHLPESLSGPCGLRDFVTLPRTKHSQSHKVRAAHHKVLDDLDDAKDLSFAFIQEAPISTIP